MACGSRRDKMSAKTDVFGKVAIGLAAGLAILAAGLRADGLENFRYAPPSGAEAAPLTTPGRFNGYTNYWHDVFWIWTRYANFTIISQPDIARTIAQARIDTAEELGLPGLFLAEGFLDALLATSVREMVDPEPGAVEKALDREDVFVWANPDSGLGRTLLGRLPDLTALRQGLGSHQFKAADFEDIRAFHLSHGQRRLFAVVTGSAGGRRRLRDLIENLRGVLGRYDLHRGWFGTGTLLHSVTCFPGHPLDVIGKGLNQGNDWFTFGGYMDYLMKDDLSAWLAAVGLDVVTDVGTGKATHSLGSLAYGLRHWDGLKIQDMPTEEEWLQFVKDRHGYVFRPVYAPDCDRFSYDGYIAADGNKKQIDGENVPFILQTGFIGEEAPPCMVLFIKKGRALTRDLMWEAIMSRRAVGVLARGRMQGPAPLRQALELLVLDRTFLEGAFQDRLSLEASVDGRELVVRVVNAGAAPVAGSLEVRTAPGLEVRGVPAQAVLPAGAERIFRAALEPGLGAMAKANPILVELRWPGGRKRALTVLELPPAVSVHKLLYGQAPEVIYPVSVHNFTQDSNFGVEVAVFAKGRPAEPVVRQTLPGRTRPGGHEVFVFRLPLAAGAYTVRASALGASSETQLGVESEAGAVKTEVVDIDGDGVPEYRLENAKVRITLLRTGARVIEYVVKERNDNILFKLWPEKEDTDKRPFRERGFYPYGGFEDFLGQASIETHRVYDAEVVRSGGTFAEVRMTADYFGNRLEKTFTLYGDSPLLEVRFALEFRNPELNMLGPQPILELGKRHWTEDVFVVPAAGGRREVRMRPEEYFGEVFFLDEGWNAARDTAEDVSFVGAFPVTEPEFLHLWMNHPSNGESHHYYAELQPWVPIFRETVRYFSYYLWGDAGPWEKSLEALRSRNLITAKQAAGARD
jgi:hypothetical protein